DQVAQICVIETIRGRGGGIVLGKRPSYIIIGDVVRETEEDFRMVECFSPDNNCIITPACSLRHVLNEALLAYMAVLDNYTLADNVKEPEMYRMILKM